MDRCIFFKATSHEAGLRIDIALTQLPEIESRNQATQLILNGQVLLSGKPIKPSKKVKDGELYEVTLVESEPLSLKPYKFRLEVLFEDDHLIVINKPAGLVVHPAVGHKNDTLVNALIYRNTHLAESSAPLRPGIVHRLDKDTSGLIVVAKSATALRHLSLQFKEKTARRIYECVVYGQLLASQGKIQSYLSRHPTDRKKFASTKSHKETTNKGKIAITHYKVLNYSPYGLSHVECRLETGRTHQIRVHMSETGHPIVADPIYCKASRTRSLGTKKIIETVEKIPRLFLHARELEFTHPKTKKKMVFNSDWPKDLQHYFNKLGFNNV